MGASQFMLVRRFRYKQVTDAACIPASGQVIQQLDYLSPSASPEVIEVQMTSGGNLVNHEPQRINGKG